MTMTLTKKDFPRPNRDLSYANDGEELRRRPRVESALGRHKPLNPDQDPRFYEPDVDA